MALIRTWSAQSSCSNRRRVSNKCRASIKRQGFEVRVLINARAFIRSSTVMYFTAIQMTFFVQWYYYIQITKVTWRYRKTERYQMTIVHCSLGWGDNFFLEFQLATHRHEAGNRGGQNCLWTEIVRWLHPCSARVASRHPTSSTGAFNLLKFVLSREEEDIWVEMWLL